MYKVIRNFFDKTDGNHLYKKDDIYPREGVKVNKTRAKAVMTGDNDTGKIYIAEIAESDAPKSDEDVAPESDAPKSDEDVAPESEE